MKLALALKREGFNSTQIAERMNVNGDTVRHWLSDPLGARQRRWNMEAYDLCECGGRKCVYARCCRDCYDRERCWSTRDIIFAVEYWAVLHGRPPRYAEWETGDGEWPSASLVKHRFETWNAAIRAAGLTPVVRGKKEELDERALDLAWLVAEVGRQETSRRTGISRASLWRALKRAERIHAARGPQGKLARGRRTLPVKPFAEWLEDRLTRYEGDVETLADDLGLEPRTMYRYRSGESRTVAPAIVHQALTATGELWRWDEWYGEVAA